MLSELALDSCDAYDRKVLKLIDDKLVEENDCLVWTGQYHNATPVRSYNGKRTSVRQLVYKMTKDNNFDQRLTSSCQTTGCLNPRHMVPWDGIGNEFALRNRKLSPDQRAEIMGTPIDLKGSGKRLADRFQVSPSLVSKIRNQRRLTSGSV